jgi:hypothetical protein
MSEQTDTSTDNFLVTTSDAPKVEETKDETKEVEVVATTETENAESKEETTATEESSETKAKPKKNRAQKRIEAVVAERNTALEENAKLKAQLASKSSTKEEPDPANFEDYEDYEKALDAFKFSKKNEEEIDPNYATAIQELQGKFDEEADKYDDFDEKINNQDLKITSYMVMAFNEMENSTDLAYYYASNPEEALKVSKMTPTKQSISVMKKSEALQKKPMKKVTTAPDPINPVGGEAEISKPLNELSFKEFEKKRNLEESQKTHW